MNRRELEQSIQELFEGEITSDRLDALRHVLRESPEARELYLDYAELHSDLGYRASGLDAVHVISMDKVVERSRAKVIKNSLISACAAVFLGMVVMAVFISHSDKPAVSLAVTPGSQFKIQHSADGKDSTDNRSMKPGSRLVLQTGSVELNFSTGVRGIIKAPADALLRAENLLELSHGTVWLEVPPQAVGFKVDTPDFLLTDLGTEFGIISDPDYHDEVHVFSGKVQVRPRDHSEDTILLAGEARFADEAGQWKEIPLRLDRFLEELPKELTASTLRVSCQSSTDEFAYRGEVSRDDLLHGLRPVYSGWNLGNHASPMELTDGVHGRGFLEESNDKVQGAWSMVGATVEYDLGRGPSGAGWDIHSIRSIASWNSAGFGNQSWMVEVKPVGGSYKVLETVNCHPLVLSNIEPGGATRVLLTDDSGVLATGIESMRFTAGHVKGSVNNSFVWRELDVFGAPTQK